MLPNREYAGWAWAPVRFVVWVLAFVYLGRVTYDNSLWDLRQQSIRFVVGRTIVLGIVAGFVYWNLFVVPPAIRAYIWSVVAIMYTAVLLVTFVVDAGAASHAIRPRKSPDDQAADVAGLVERDRRVAGKQLGDVPTRDRTRVKEER